MVTDFISVLEREIEYHQKIYLESNDLSPDFKDGFLQGLKQARDILMKMHDLDNTPERETEIAQV